MIHLVCGPLGAGKTTVANELSETYGAIRFSEDDWLNMLFVPEAPADLMDESPDVIAHWAMDKYPRCREAIWNVCDQLLEQDISIVLDGFAGTKALRDFVRSKAEAHRVAFQLYYVTADADLRRKRVLERNTNKDSSFSLAVSSGMFDLMEQHFEEPQKEELEGAHII